MDWKFQTDFTIQSERLHLRPVTQSDCNDVYISWLNNWKINHYLETRFSEQTEESIKHFVQSMSNSPDNALMAIILQEHHQHIGNIKLGPVNWHHRCSEISYFIGETRYWGQGFAPEAIGLMLQLAFTHLNLHRVQAGCYSSNVGSVRALEKNGFTLEGRWRKQLKTECGWDDHLWFGLLAEEWQQHIVRIGQT